MKNMQNLGMVAACALLALSTSALKATSFNFDLDSAGLGSGQVTTTEISPGIFLATSGYFNLDAGGPYAPVAATGTLIPTAGLGLWNGGVPFGPTVFDWRSYGGTDLGFDDLIVQTGPAAYSVTYFGLLFRASTGPGTGLDFGPSLNSPGDYSNVGMLYNGAVPGNEYAPYAAWVDPINLTLTDPPSVPDGGLTAGLLGGALAGLGALRRKFQS